MEDRAIPSQPGRTSALERLPAFYSRTAVVAAFIVAALLLAAAIVDQRTTTALHADVRSVTRTHQILQSAEKILSTLIDAETGHRGYLLTGDSAYLEPYEDARQSLSGLLDEAERLTREDSQHQDRLKRVRAAADDRMRIIAGSIALQRAGRRDKAADDLANERGKAAMDRIRRVVAEMVDAESLLLAAREHKAEESFRWSVAVSWIGSGLGLFGLTAFVVLLVRHIRAASIATRSLFQQRELLRTTLASIADAVVTTDAEGRVTSINDVASALTGWGS